MQKSLASVLVMFPLLGEVGTQAAIAATNDPPGIPVGQAPIVKVEEGCGNGYFRDEYGNCRQWYGGEPAHAPHEGCPSNSISSIGLITKGDFVSQTIRVTGAGLGRVLWGEV